MVRLVIKGCEFDPAQVKDVVFGDSFRMELDKAMELANAGVEFWAAGPDGIMARVSLGQNEYGERILMTEPNAWAANHLGEIVAPPVVRRPYRAEAHVPSRMSPAYAIAA
jgi:hypothetical protein